MLDFPIIDTHLHVWDPRRLRYPWLDDIPLLNKPYLLEDYDRACGPVAVEKTGLPASRGGRLPIPGRSGLGR